MKLLTLLFFLPHLSIGMDTTWWKHTIVYEIFVWSFKDSNGDGNGDIAGSYIFSRVYLLLLSNKKCLFNTS